MKATARAGEPALNWDPPAGRRLAAILVVCFVASVPLLTWAVDVGVALTPSHGLGVALMAFAFGVWVTRRPRLSIDPATVSAASFFVAAAISVALVFARPDIEVLGESARRTAVKQLVGLGFGLSVFAALYHVCRWFGLTRVLLRTHLYTAGVIGVLTFGQFAIAREDLLSPWANFALHNSTFGETRLLSLFYGFPRVSLTLVEPSFLATYLLTGWSLWLFTLDRPALLGGRFKALFLLMGLPIGAAVFVTGSRLAYVVFVAVSLAAVFMRSGRGPRLLLLGACVAGGLAMVGPTRIRSVLASLGPQVLSEEAVRERVGLQPSTRIEAALAGHDYSVQWRTASYLVAASLMREHPLTGAGLGTAPLHMHARWPRGFPRPPGLTQPPAMLSHYAAIAAETGVAGLTCLAAFTLALLGRLRAATRAGHTRVQAGAVAGSLASYAVFAAVTGVIAYQWLLVWVLVVAALTVGDAPDAGVGAESV